ncbi:MAG: ABC transporter substrate-binding protein [Xanthobacteraceae bacterium]
MKQAFAAAAAVLIAALTSGSGFAQEKVVVWWNKGFYEAEDKALEAVIKKWEAANPDKKIELTFIPLTDVIPKTVSAIQAQSVPDIGFGWLYDFQTSASWAAQGVLEDLGDVVAPIKDRLMPGIVDTVTMGGKDGKRAIYAAPIHMQNMHYHYWKDMVEEAGFKASDVPRDWKGFWDFWCVKVQDALRKKGQRIYGIGLPSSTAATDTFYTYYTFLGAYGVSMLDKAGKLTIDDPKVKEGMKRALEDYAAIHAKGCTPPGSISWTDADNNNNFHNRTTVSTPNPSVSIPGKHLDDKALDNYYNKIVTVEWPDGPDGTKIVYTIAVKQALVFSAARNKAGAKSFLSFLLRPENIGPYTEGSLGRWFPVQTALADRDFWKDPKDPHKTAVYRQYTERPFVPMPSVLNPGFTQLQNENVFAKAIGRIVIDKWDSGRALDEMIARIKAVAG